MVKDLDSISIQIKIQHGARCRKLGETSKNFLCCVLTKRCLWTTETKKLTSFHEIQTCAGSSVNIEAVQIHASVKLLLIIVQTEGHLTCRLAQINFERNWCWWKWKIHLDPWGDLCVVTSLTSLCFFDIAVKMQTWLLSNLCAIWAAIAIERKNVEKKREKVLHGVWFPNLDNHWENQTEPVEPMEFCFLACWRKFSIQNLIWVLDHLVKKFHWKRHFGNDFIQDIYIHIYFWDTNLKQKVNSSELAQLWRGSINYSNGLNSFILCDINSSIKINNDYTLTVLCAANQIWYRMIEYQLYCNETSQNCPLKFENRGKDCLELLLRFPVCWSVYFCALWNCASYELLLASPSLSCPLKQRMAF